MLARVSQKSGRSKDALAPQKAPKKAKGEDVVLIRGVSESGDLAVLRAREDRVEAGVVRPVQEGAPLEGEVVTLKPRADFPLLCDVEVEVPQGAVNALGGSDGARGHKGPAQVATTTYRKNWDSIWPRPRANKRSKLN